MAAQSTISAILNKESDRLIRAFNGNMSIVENRLKDIESCLNNMNNKQIEKEYCRVFGINQKEIVMRNEKEEIRNTTEKW